MTSAETIQPGCFFLVVGPSGAGKDSLMDGARVQLPKDQFVFATRKPHIEALELQIAIDFIIGDLQLTREDVVQSVSVAISHQGVEDYVSLFTLTGIKSKNG